MFLSWFQIRILVQTIVDNTAYNWTQLLSNSPVSKSVKAQSSATIDKPSTIKLLAIAFHHSANTRSSAIVIKWRFLYNDVSVLPLSSYHLSFYNWRDRIRSDNYCGASLPLFLSRCTLRWDVIFLYDPPSSSYISRISCILIRFCPPCTCRLTSARP